MSVGDPPLLPITLGFLHPWHDFFASTLDPGWPDAGTGNRKQSKGKPMTQWARSRTRTILEVLSYNAVTLMG